MSNYKFIINRRNLHNIEVHVDELDEDQIIDVFIPNSSTDKMFRLLEDTMGPDVDYCHEIVTALVKTFIKMLERNGHTATMEVVDDE